MPRGAGLQTLQFSSFQSVQLFLAKMASPLSTQRKFTAKMASPLSTQRKFTAKMALLSPKKCFITNPTVSQSVSSVVPAR